MKYPARRVFVLSCRHMDGVKPSSLFDAWRIHVRSRLPHMLVDLLASSRSLDTS
jgi:hypothetical protein